jgi:hypothetical protein
MPYRRILPRREDLSPFEQRVTAAIIAAHPGRRSADPGQRGHSSGRYRVG